MRPWGLIPVAGRRGVSLADAGVGWGVAAPRGGARAGWGRGVHAKVPGANERHARRTNLGPKSELWLCWGVHEVPLRSGAERAVG